MQTAENEEAESADHSRRDGANPEAAHRFNSIRSELNRLVRPK